MTPGLLFKTPLLTRLTS